MDYVSDEVDDMVDDEIVDEGDDGYDELRYAYRHWQIAESARMLLEMNIQA